MLIAKLIDCSSVLRPYTIRKVARIESNDNLMHYGIKGMKWGVRRTKEQLAHDRSSIQARMNSKLRTPVKASNYIESKASLKTVTLVGGEGEGADRRYTTVGGGSGLNRRELFTDARDISSNVGSDDALTDAEYMAQLQQRGKEKLAENVSITSFEGETETTIMFQYGKDFFNGDIVQIANEYGHETKARILEIVRSEDKDGYSVYPTFKTIEQEGA